MAESKLQDRQLPQPPNGVAEPLFTFLRHLINALASFITDVRNLQNSGKQTLLHLDILENEPASPFDGMIAYADGTSWNPGSGEGVYAYESGVWVKL